MMGLTATTSSMETLPQQLPFLRGINIAWLWGQYDHDFARNSLHPDWGVWFKLDKIRELLDMCAELEFQAIRTWIFEGCEGLQFDDVGYVKGLQPEFMRNIGQYFDECEKRSIWLYPCMTTYWPKQRPSPITDRKARDQYIKFAVRPFVRSLKSRSNIVAIDIFNEIESEVVDKRKASLASRNFRSGKKFPCR
jgi:hypothetical protein